MKCDFWADLKTTDFEEIDAQHDIAILPMAATEQHGPHLPLSTDTDIMNGILKELTFLKDESKGTAYILPSFSIGYSIEHSQFKGSLTLKPDVLLTMIEQIIDQIASLGFKNLLILSSHGGNNELIAILARQAKSLNIPCAFSTHLMRFLHQFSSLYTLPIDKKSFSEDVHGGFIETSLMLHFAPEKVDMKKAEKFMYNSALYNQMIDFKDIKSISNPVPLAWMAKDLNPKGVVGEANLASSKWGELIARTISQNLFDFLKEIDRVNKIL